MWDVKEYRFASSPAEAVALLRRGPGHGAYIAGGTDLRRGKHPCDFVVDINHVGIDIIDLHPDGDLFIGAAAPVVEAARDRRIGAFAGGALTAALEACRGGASRRAATVGGQLCHRGRCGDLAPVLLALDADCVIADEAATATVPLCTFYRGDGSTALADRLLVGLVVPRTARLRRCLALRRVPAGGGPTLVQVAVGLDVVENRIVNLRIGLGAAARAPGRAARAEAVLAGLDPRAVGPDQVQECADTAAAEITALEDDRASAGYRRNLVAVLTRRVLSRALGWQESEEGDRLA